MVFYQVDAFTDHLFGGNPAAVVPLEEWIPDTLMQQLAMENNLAETVFFVPSPGEETDFYIRWFTPEAEINLCGHATLASACVLFDVLGFEKSTVGFQSKSGPLYVHKEQQGLMMDFPSWEPEPANESASIIRDVLGETEIKGFYERRDLLAELPTEEDVRSADPDLRLLRKTGRNLIITAPGDSVDFVSRFFAPAIGVDEDPVTGSAHAQLIPFWSSKLNKTIMRARQLSKRGGLVLCEQREGRVMIGGRCVLYMKGEIVGL